MLSRGPRGDAGVRARGSFARTARRRTRAGFSLIELMVVVVLISILAVLAIPGLRGSRDDRYVFGRSQEIAQLFHNARNRARARGSAHIVVAEAGGTNRGNFRVFEALDPTTTPAGRPLNTCREVGQWANLPNVPDPKYRMVDWVNLNGVDNVEGKSDVMTTLTVQSGGTPLGVNLFVACFSPYGNMYVGNAGGVAAAVTAMGTPGSLPFSGTVRATVNMRRAGNPVGIGRTVIVAPGGGTRIKSQ